MKYLAMLGEQLNAAFFLFFSTCGIVFYSFRKLFIIFRSPMTLRIFLEQFTKELYQSGIRALYITSAISIMTGILVALVVDKYLSAQSTQLLEFYYRFLVDFIIKELGPLISGIILIVRSATFMSVKMALMRYYKEFELLRSMGISPIYYVLLPSMLSLPLSFIAIVIYFDFMSVSASYFVLFLHEPSITFSDFWLGVLHILTLSDIAVSLLKAYLGGMLMFAVSFHFAQHFEAKLSNIAEQTSNAVTTQLIIFFVLNVFLSVVLYI